DGDVSGSGTEKPRRAGVHAPEVSSIRRPNLQAVLADKRAVTQRILPDPRGIKGCALRIPDRTLPRRQHRIRARKYAVWLGWLQKPVGEVRTARFRIPVPDATAEVEEWLAARIRFFEAAKCVYEADGVGSREDHAFSKQRQGRFAVPPSEMHAPQRTHR